MGSALAPAEAAAVPEARVGGVDPAGAGAVALAEPVRPAWLALAAESSVGVAPRTPSDARYPWVLVSADSLAGVERGAPAESDDGRGEPVGGVPAVFERGRVVDVVLDFAVSNSTALTVALSVLGVSALAASALAAPVVAVSDPVPRVVAESLVAVSVLPTFLVSAMAVAVSALAESTRGTPADALCVGFRPAAD